MEIVLTSTLVMARERKARLQGTTWNIDENARLAILKRITDPGRPISQADLARACNVTPSAITLLLKKPIAPGRTRGCKFLPALERELGMVSTTKPTPLVQKSEHARRALRLLDALQDDPEALDLWVRNGEMLVSKR